MLKPPPVFYRPGRGRKTKKPVATPTPPPPAALVLVAAEYDVEVTVTLTFDRAIDVAGLVGTAIIVDDDNTGMRYHASGAVTMINPQTVRIEVVGFEPSGAAGTLLTATGGTGIVAVDDGGMWAGVSGVPLPFP